MSRSLVRRGVPLWLALAAGTAVGELPEAGEPATLPVDAGTAGDAVPDAGAPSLAIEELRPASPSSAGTPGSEPLESFQAPPVFAPRFFGEVRASLGVDTSFDSRGGDELPENVFELRGRTRLGVDAKLSNDFRVLLEGRLWWRGAARRGLSRTKASFEASLGEAFVDVYSPLFDLRIGNQVLVFGANAALAPSDALNPRDLRESLLAAEPEDAKLPVPALRALGTLGKVEVTLAYVPFFEPNRYNVFGHDDALVQPAVGGRIPTQLDASVEDELQPHLLETERPQAFPWLGDVGVRLRTDAGQTKVGASWVWLNDKLPAVTVDPELATFLAIRQRGRDDPALAVSLQNRFLAGEELYRGTYPRRHVLSLEATRLLGAVQLDVDLSWSPRQTFVDDALAPVQKPSVTWVVGLGQAEDSDFTYSLAYLGMAVPAVRADELLFLLEPSTAQGATRTAWLHVLVGLASYRLLDDQLELSVRAAVEPIQRSFVLAPRVACDLTDDVALSLGAELYEGDAYSPFGYFGRNDQVLLGVTVRLP